MLLPPLSMTQKEKCAYRLAVSPITAQFGNPPIALFLVRLVKAVQLPTNHRHKSALSHSITLKFQSVIPAIPKTSPSTSTLSTEAYARRRG